MKTRLNLVGAPQYVATKGPMGIECLTKTRDENKPGNLIIGRKLFRNLYHVIVKLYCIFKNPSNPT